MFRWSRKTYKEASRLARTLRNYGDANWPEPLPVKHFIALWEAYEERFQYSDPFRTPLRLRLEFHKDPVGYIPF